MSDFLEKILADLVEGGRNSEGFMRGSRPTVIVARENRGREEKLASHALLDGMLKSAIFGGAGGLMSPQSVASSMLSGGGAAMRPQAVAPAAKATGAKPPPLPQAALNRMHASSPFAAGPKLGQSFEHGMKAACAAFGVKEAFLPALAGLAARAAPMIGRALTAAKPAAQAVGNFAMKNPVGQQMAGAAGANLINRAMTPQQPAY